MKTWHQVVFLLIFVICLFAPNGSSVLLFSGYQISSPYDGDYALLPFLNIQILALTIYVILYHARVYINKSLIAPISSLFLLPIFFSFFSVSLHGYLLFAEMIPVVLLSFITFTNICEDKYFVANTFTKMPIVALPFYILDLIHSHIASDENGFVSLVFASNGHTFISYFLFIMVFYSFTTGLYYERKIRIVSFAAAIVYLCGGLLSGGKTGLIACVFAVAMSLKRRYRFIVILFFLTLILIVLASSENLADQIDNFLTVDFDEQPFWSSMRSRLEFWNVFSTMFVDNIISGYGGLIVNQFKYNYGFPYDVFVDPHNEILHLLVGYGISSIVLLLIFVYAIRQYTKSYSSNKKSMQLRSFSPIYTYIFIAELTNANMAKPNIMVTILMVICFTLFLSVPGTHKYEYKEVK